MSESTEENMGTEEEGADETEENSGIFAESE